MSTRSRIGRLFSDGHIESIYSHWDGYPAGVGATLAAHYTDNEKISELLALGDISILGAEIGSAQDFNHPRDGETLAYHRDRGENYQAPTRAEFPEQFMTQADSTQAEYAYLWDGFGWLCAPVVRRDDGSWAPLRSISQLKVTA